MIGLAFNAINSSTRITFFEILNPEASVIKASIEIDSVSV